MNTINAGSYEIHSVQELIPALKRFLEAKEYSQVFVLADDHTAEVCVPLIGPDYPDPIVIPHGEKHKTIASCEVIWKHLTDAGADRKAVLLNVGGGLIGDLGGFAASTYKRGIDFVQIPTSLLAMVDASVGGKTGVNFDHFKNQVGAFKDPAAVFIYPTFLNSLPQRELESGFAEVIKHCLIADRPRWETLLQQEDISQMDWAALIPESVQVKLSIVQQDPFEKGPRKALNFGHTIGHAIESYFIEEAPSPFLHGEAVILGMLAEAWISWHRGLISQSEWEQIARYLGLLAREPALRQPERLQIARLALQDKKNEGKRILCTLLDGIGGFKINQEITVQDILDSLAVICPITP